MRSVAICKGPLSLQMKGWYFEVEVSILERRNSGAKKHENLGEHSSNLRSTKITVHGGVGREILSRLQSKSNSMSRSSPPGQEKVC